MMASPPPSPLDVMGSASMPTDSGRVYRDAHRIVLRSAAPRAGIVRHVCVRLHDAPAGPLDGSGRESRGR